MSRDTYVGRVAIWIEENNFRISDCFEKVKRLRAENEAYRWALEMYCMEYPNEHPRVQVLRLLTRRYLSS